MTVGEKNVINEPLVDWENNFSAAEHQPGINETVFKALNKEGNVLPVHLLGFSRFEL